MQLNIDPDWFLWMIEKENNCILSVGGLVTRLVKEASITMDGTEDQANSFVRVTWKAVAWRHIGVTHRLTQGFICHFSTENIRWKSADGKDKTEAYSTFFSWKRENPYMLCFDIEAKDSSEFYSPPHMQELSTSDT